MNEPFELEVVVPVARPSHRIAVLTDAESWLQAHLPSLVAALEGLGHRVTLVNRPADVPVGDFLICLSSTRLVPRDVLARNRHNLVVHQSELPKGRGWSPLTWQILEGRDVVPVCLFEAAEAVDSGVVYLRDAMRFDGTELVDELRAEQARCSERMLLRFFQEYPAIVARGEAQVGEPTFYARRGPEANRLDPDRTLREQFNTLRVADNDRYPAYVEIGGETYVIKIEKRAKTPLVPPSEAPAPAEPAPLDAER